MQQEELNLKGARKISEDAKKEQFKRAQRLFELRQKERELISEISGGACLLVALLMRVLGHNWEVWQAQSIDDACNGCSSSGRRIASKERELISEISGGPWCAWCTSCHLMPPTL